MPKHFNLPLINPFTPSLPPQASPAPKAHKQQSSSSSAQGPSTGGGKPLKYQQGAATQKSLINNYQSNQAEGLPLSRVEDAIFNGANDSLIPRSHLNGRNQKNYAPKRDIASIGMLGQGPLTSRVGIYSGGITDLKATHGEKFAIGDSNNGDLFTGCGYAVAKAVINAAGAGLQKELYDRFGVPQVMEQPKNLDKKYKETENRGYAISCAGYDMQKTHGVSAIEVLTVPMYNLDGLKNMYREALEHSKDKDFILLPMAGMSHPLLEGKKDLSARVSMEAAHNFYMANPDSPLKIVFAIFSDPESVDLYAGAAKRLESKQPVQKAQPPKADNSLSLLRIEAVLFKGLTDEQIPRSRLGQRNQDRYKPTTKLRTVAMVGEGKYSHRIGIHSGSITDIEATQGEKFVVGCSNSGDLFMGSDFPIGKAVINAAGAGLQKELYDNYGVAAQGRSTSYGRERYGKTENRGYALTCGAYDMANTHKVSAIELLTVPENSEAGLVNMYREAMEHSKNKEYLLLPMAGMSSTLLRGHPEKSAELSIRAAKQFYDANPNTRLKIVFAIFNDKYGKFNESLYKNQIKSMDSK